MNLGVWFTEYAEVTKRMAAVLKDDDVTDMGVIMDVVDACLIRRQALLDQIEVSLLDEEEKVSFKKYLVEVTSIEEEISKKIQERMRLLDEEHREIKDARTAVTLHRKANRSYGSIVTSNEGYFIDRKK